MASAPPWADEEVIREELFSVERLEQHAESLAAAQSVSSQPQRGRPLAERVGENNAALLDAYRVIAAAIKDSAAVRKNLNTRVLTLRHLQFKVLPVTTFSPQNGRTAVSNR